MASSAGKTVALVVDHPQRDLAGLVLVAHRLAQAGVICHLVPLNLRESEVWALEPDLVVLNFLRRGSEAFAERLLSAGVRYALLDTEGGAWTKAEDYAQLLWPDEPLRRAARPLCLWGPKMADYLTTHRWFDADAVRVTGCPRFDFYAPQWRSVLFDAPPSSQTTRPRVLINTNFSLTNGRFATPEQNLQQVREELGWSDETVKSMVAAERSAIAGMIELVSALARDFPEADIVLRPHPFERLATYDAAIRAAPNVVLSAGGPVQPEILQAAVVIQRSCTTAAEAALASVPALSPQWIPAPILVPMAEAASVPCATYAETKTAVQAVLDGRWRAPDDCRHLVDGVIHDWFFRADGLAHERVSSAIVEALEQPRRVNSRMCRRHLYGLHERAGLAGLGRRVRHTLRLSPSFSFTQLRPVPNTHWRQTDKMFLAEDVGRLLGRIEQAERAQGRDPRPVLAEAAGVRGDFRGGYEGYAVTMAPASGASAA